MDEQMIELEGVNLEDLKSSEDWQRAEDIFSRNRLKLYGPEPQTNPSDTKRHS